MSFDTSVSVVPSMIFSTDSWIKQKLNFMHIIVKAGFEVQIFSTFTPVWGHIMETWDSCTPFTESSKLCKS